ncbi:hypothetical protein FHG87_000542 [Trinorchestia longiramus]|nr:hypothetical protein FHG87_000542 [Trinorchestia longiramus]
MNRVARLVLRLGTIQGYEGRTNHVVYAAPTIPSNLTQVVIFFPGDVQNYPEQMVDSEESLRCWNLESVCEMLAERRPQSHILVVRPNRMEKQINFYDNFVTLNRFGGIDYLKSRFALPHLYHLVHNTLQSIQASDHPLQKLKRAADQLAGREDGESSSCAVRDEQPLSGPICDASAAVATPTIDTITLVAFSKGCVVLNQLVTEIYLMSELSEQDKRLYGDFLQKVDEMAWLDGGHQGREGTWITNPNFIKKLVSVLPRLQITIHVTPYQMHDAFRPWIGNECRRFESLCREVGARVSSTMHGADHSTCDINTHFLALDAYAK